MTGISIVLCCYNSVTRLEVTLRALSRLQVPAGVPVELLFVDNNSTDGTPERAAEWWGEYGAPYEMTFLTENKQGIGYARLSGVRSVRYDWILFVDDDNELASDYLEKAVSFLSAHPDVGVLGGISQGVFPGELPSWMQPGFPFKPLLTSLAVSTPEHSFSGYLDHPSDYLFTAGTFISKKVFTPVLGLNYESLLKSRIGNQLLSGEDEEFCCWAKMMGLRLYRLDTLGFRHHITAPRLEKAYFERLFFGFGYGSIILDMYREVLQGHVLPPQKAGKERRARIKIIILSAVEAVLGIFLSDKMFKAKLLVHFQRGIIQYLRDTPRLEEVHNKILLLGKSLRA